MKQGTLLIKKTGRDELYWVATFLASYAAWHAASLFTDSVYTCALFMGVVVVAMIAAKFTVLRSWSVDHVDWFLTKRTLNLAGQDIPLNSIDQIYFQRNKLTGSSWYLNGKGAYRIHLESLSYPPAKRSESLETMKELAFAVDPSLKGKPSLLPN